MGVRISGTNAIILFLNNSYLLKFQIIILIVSWLLNILIFFSLISAFDPIFSFLIHYTLILNL